MKNITLSRRTKTLLIIFAVLLLAVVYYELVFRMYSNAMSEYDTSELETEITTEQTKVIKEKKMQDYLESHQNVSYGALMPYNNMPAEVLAMGNILNGQASNINITWSDPTQTDDTVRRVAAVSFDTATYQSARSLVNAISSFPYRCIISDLSINAGDGSISKNSVSVSMNVTCFETMTNANSNTGLVQAQ
ncbi:hypothetical protein ACKX2L_03010 [Lachnospiraceae bacterium YH-ros2228]